MKADIIDITDTIYKIDLCKPVLDVFEKCKRNKIKTKIVKYREKKYDHFDLEKTNICFERFLDRNIGPSSDLDVVYLDNENITECKPVDLLNSQNYNDKNNQEIVFRLNMVYNYISHWFLSTNMLNGLKSVKITLNHTTIITIPKILIMIAPRTDDNLILFPMEFLQSTFIEIRVIFEYETIEYRDLALKDAKLILKTGFIVNIINYNAKIPIYDFRLIKADINHDTDNTYKIDAFNLSGTFRKFILIFQEENKVNFSPIKFIEFVHSGVRIIYREIFSKGFSKEKENIYICKFKKPFPSGFFDNIHFNVGLPENHGKGILYIICYIKNIVSYNGLFMGLHFL